MWEFGWQLVLGLRSMCIVSGVFGIYIDLSDQTHHFVCTFECVSVTLLRVSTGCCQRRQTIQIINIINLSRWVLLSELYLQN